MKNIVLEEISWSFVGRNDKVDEKRYKECIPTTNRCDDHSIERIPMRVDERDHTSNHGLMLIDNIHMVCFLFLH